MPLQLEAIADDGELLQQAANDFWRRHLAGDALDPLLAAHLVRRKDSPQRFAQLLKRHVAKPTALARWPQAVAPIDDSELAGAHARARTLWQGQRATIVDTLNGGLEGMKSNIYKATTVAAAIEEWDALLSDADAAAGFALKPDKLELLGREKLDAGAKKGHAAPVHAFFDAAQALLDARAAAAPGLDLARLALLRRLLDEGSAALRADKRQRRVVAFDDMLFNLHQRLHDAATPALAAALRARFPAALIDEFQDTDPLQWQIFDAIYGDGALPLFLVGDPKQAIYSFRNADLHTYLRARERATAAYPLRANQRATEPLLGALNALFGVHRDAFMLSGLDYRDVTMGDKPRPDNVDALARALRAGSPPVIGHVVDGALLLDVRTVLPGQEEDLVRAVREAHTA
jgi:exodeoxyribonuclease V beta subunit